MILFYQAEYNPIYKTNNKAPMTDNKFLNATLCLYIPILFIIIQTIIEMTLPTQTLDVLHNEYGSHELLQALIVFIAFIIGVKTLRQPMTKYLRAWIALATVCCFYVTGEELSWGQHAFYWQTPEGWAALNDQQETNLHNTSSWLDQKPRILLEIGVVVGGLIIPFLLKYKPHKLPEKFKAIYPTACFVATALIFAILKILDQAESYTGNIMTRISEVEELYLFYFVLLYMILMHKRVKQA